MRVRACVKCKQYARIFTNNPINQEMLKEFERKHSEHTVVTIDLSEVKGSYTNFENLDAQGSNEAAT